MQTLCNYASNTNNSIVKSCNCAIMQIIHSCNYAFMKCIQRYGPIATVLLLFIPDLSDFKRYPESLMKIRVGIGIIMIPPGFSGWFLLCLRINLSRSISWHIPNFHDWMFKDSLSFNACREGSMEQNALSTALETR